MNANDLAFHSLIVRLTGAGYFEAATLLRQQAARILELENILDDIKQEQMDRNLS